jgi:hypothetical protein
MVPALQRMMERMPAAAASKAAVWIDPVVLVSCFILWGGRIRKIKAEEAARAYGVTPFEYARANGAAGSEYRVDSNQQPNANGGAYRSHIPDYRGPSANLSDIDAAARDRSIEPDASGEVTSNGVPQSIREAFDERI